MSCIHVSMYSCIHRCAWPWPWPRRFQVLQFGTRLLEHWQPFFFALQLPVHCQCQCLFHARNWRANRPHRSDRAASGPSLGLGEVGDRLPAPQARCPCRGALRNFLNTSLLCRVFCTVFCLVFFFASGKALFGSASLFVVPLFLLCFVVFFVEFLALHFGQFLRILSSFLHFFLYCFVRKLLKESCRVGMHVKKWKGVEFKLAVDRQTDRHVK